MLELCGIDVVLVFGLDVPKVGICLEYQVLNPLEAFSVLEFLGWALD